MFAAWMARKIQGSSVLRPSWTIRRASTVSCIRWLLSLGISWCGARGCEVVRVAPGSSKSVTGDDVSLLDWPVHWWQKQGLYLTPLVFTYHHLSTCPSSSISHCWGGLHRRLRAGDFVAWAISKKGLWDDSQRKLPYLEYILEDHLNLNVSDGDFDGSVWISQIWTKRPINRRRNRCKEIQK